MIKYNSQLRTFVLEGKSVTYMMYVNHEGFLQFCYFGAKIEPDEYISAVIGEDACGEMGINVDQSLDWMRPEYGSFGKGDFHNPSIMIKQKDGTVSSRLVYSSHKIVSGAPNIPDMPHVRGGGQTLAVTLKDELSPAEIVLYYTVFDDSDVLVRSAEIKNTGKDALHLLKAYSFCIEPRKGNYELMRLYGGWARERNIEVTPIPHGATRIESLRGASSAQMNPFAALVDKNATETSGACMGFNLVYSGSFAISVETSEYDEARVQGGINETGFDWTLGKGESFFTPQALICYSDNGLGGMSREFADFHRAHIIDPARVNMQRPIVINNWEATYFDFNNQKLCSIIDAAAELGIDTFVLDDGWFGARRHDRAGLGDWVESKDVLPNGLKEIADHCKKKGLKFGLWFEPEMVNEDSDLFRAHPDWAIGRRTHTPTRWRNQLVLDFSRAEVVDYIFESMKKVLESCDISYIKWDMNRNITDMYSATLPADRHGEFLHRYILGVYSLAERITKAFPDLFMEGCASGGGRFDGGMLYYFPQIWTSDDTDAHERTKIQYGTSMCYPASSMSCHVSVCPNHQTGRTAAFATRGAVAMLGAFGYELDLTKLSDEDKQAVKQQVKDYRNISELVLKGDLYRLMNPFTDDYFCEMIVSKDKKHAYLAGAIKLRTPHDTQHYVKLVGLDPDKKYRIKELDIVAHGKTLANVGLLIPRDLKDFDSWVWHIEAV